MGKIKETNGKLKAERVSFFTDFKKFITKGNVLDMAVGVVIGAAFNAIVTGLVKNIITPLMEKCTGGIAIEEWKTVLTPAVEAVEANPELGIEAVAAVPEVAILWGLWLQAIIDFFIIALCIFTAVRVIKSLERKMNAKEIAKAEAEAAAKKAEEDAKAAEEKAAAEAKAAAEKAILDEYYANIKEQTALLRELAKK